jgi:trans-aconitate methyltransferase
MIQAAREHQAPNLKFAVSDINELNFQEQFDVVFSNATLHWIKDHQNLLRRVFQSLRHNGMARFNFAGDGNCAHFNQVVQAIMCQAEYAAYFQSFDWPWYMPKVEDYRTIAGQFQFREVQVWNENADRYFPDAKALIRWIDQPSLVPFLARVDTAAQGRFRANVIKAMLKATRQPDGRCFETFRRLNLLARK